MDLYTDNEGIKKDIKINTYRYIKTSIYEYLFIHHKKIVTDTPL